MAAPDAISYCDVGGGGPDAQPCLPRPLLVRPIVDMGSGAYGSSLLLTSAVFRPTSSFDPAGQHTKKHVRAAARICLFIKSVAWKAAT